MKREPELSVWNSDEQWECLAYLHYCVFMHFSHYYAGGKKPDSLIQFFILLHNTLTANGDNLSDRNKQFIETLPSSPAFDIVFPGKKISGMVRTKPSYQQLFAAWLNQQQNKEAANIIAVAKQKTVPYALIRRVGEFATSKEGGYIEFGNGEWTRSFKQIRPPTIVEYYADQFRLQAREIFDRPDGDKFHFTAVDSQKVSTLLKTAEQKKSGSCTQLCGLEYDKLVFPSTSTNRFWRAVENWWHKGSIAATEQRIKGVMLTQLAQDPAVLADTARVAKLRTAVTNVNEKQEQTVRAFSGSWFRAGASRLLVRLTQPFKKLKELVLADHHEGEGEAGESGDGQATSQPQTPATSPVGSLISTAAGEKSKLAGSPIRGSEFLNPAGLGNDGAVASPPRVVIHLAPRLKPKLKPRALLPALEACAEPSKIVAAPVNTSSVLPNSELSHPHTPTLPLASPLSSSRKRKLNNEFVPPENLQNTTSMTHAPNVQTVLPQAMDEFSPSKRRKVVSRQQWNEHNPNNQIPSPNIPKPNHTTVNQRQVQTPRLTPAPLSRRDTNALINQSLFAKKQVNQSRQVNSATFKTNNNRSRLFTTPRPRPGNATARKLPANNIPSAVF